jgi:putative methionine-R-sulfoxide reductase with GAF domain
VKHLHIDPELLPKRQNLLRGYWIRWFIIAIIVFITLLNLQNLAISTELAFAVIAAFALYNLTVHYITAAHKLSLGFIRVMYASDVSLAPLLDIGIILFLVVMIGDINSEFFYILVLRIIYSAATSSVRAVAIQTIIASISYLVVIVAMDSAAVLTSALDVVLRLGILWPAFFIVSFVNRERNLNLTIVRELDRRLRLLLELSSWINRAKDLSGILDFATRASYSLVNGTSSSTVLILSEDEKYLRLRANTGLSPAEMDELMTVGIPIEQGVVGVVARTGKSEILPDVEQDPRYLRMRGDIHSEMTVPIISEGKVIGVFNLESTEKNAFSEDDLRYMETLCDIVAVAIHNHKLYAQ